MGMKTKVIRIIGYNKYSEDRHVVTSRNGVPLITYLFKYVMELNY